MNGDKEVGALLQAQMHAIHERHIAIRVAGHDQTHSGGAADQLGQGQADIQHHILFAGPLGADGARIMAAVTGIQADHNGSPCPGDRLPTGGFYGGCRERHQIQHQAMCGTSIGTQRKTAPAHRFP